MHARVWIETYIAACYAQQIESSARSKWYVRIKASARRRRQGAGVKDHIYIYIYKAIIPTTSLSAELHCRHQAPASPRTTSPKMISATSTWRLKQHMGLDAEHGSAGPVHESVGQSGREPCQLERSGVRDLRGDSHK